MSLYSYQQEALRILKERKHINLWWATGLGKGHFLASIVTSGSFIICPPHLTGDWVSKLQELQPGTKINILDKDNLNFFCNCVNICSLQKWYRYSKTMARGIKGSMLIVDEAHMIKNPKSVGYKSILKIVDKFEYYVAASATFMTRTNLDLFTNAFLASPMLRRQYKNSFWNFCQTNVDHKTIWNGSKSISVPDTIRPTVLKKLILNNYNCHDYKSAGVAEPERIDQVIKHKGNKQLDKMYKQLSGEIGSYSQEEMIKMKPEQLEEILELQKGLAFRLNQLANSFMYQEDKEAKSFNYKEKLELLKSILATEAEKKGLIFYQYKFEAEQLKSALKGNFVEWDGQESIAAFEAGKMQVMIANYTSIGTGVRFKKTDFTVEFSINYDYGAVEQSRGRLRFVGRSTPYKVYKFHLQHTVANKIVKVLELREKESKEIQKRLKGGF